MKFRLYKLIAAITLIALLVGTTSAAQAAQVPTVDIQILNVSDWHGQLDPVNVAGVGNVGGAAVISAYWKADRLANPNTLTLTAGDDFGASPPLSNYFDDVPAILAQRLMGIQVGTFGNHDFDGGIAHLQCMVDVAAAPNDPNFTPGVYDMDSGCPLTSGGPGTPFSYVSANLKNRDDNLTGVEDFKIFDVGGIKVAVIGLTNPEAPTLVFPGNFGTIVPTDPIPAANKARVAARRAGAQVFIAITHLGVTSIDPATGAPSGPLIDFANNVGGFDVIVGDHTDIRFSGVINNALVYENLSKGVTYARAQLTFDLQTKKVKHKSVEFVTPLVGAVIPDQAIVDMLVPYRTELSQIFDTPIGVATALFPRGGNIERSGEVAIGNLIADALRLKYGTQLALTNAGGIRQSLPSNYAPADTSLRRTAAPYVIGPPYDLVIGDVFAVLPFGNTVVTRSVTGAQLWAALENGVSQINPSTCNGADGRFPQISGFKFTFKCSNPAGSRVLSVSLTDNTPIPADGTTYTFTTNNFVNAGGDFYSMLNDGQGTTREVMFDVVLEYIQNAGTITPTIEGRITKVP